MMMIHPSADANKHRFDTQEGRNQTETAEVDG